MDKRKSFPPLTILIDLLFILLVIVLLNNDETKIKIPEDIIFKDATLIYDDGLKYIVNQDTQELEGLFLPNKNTNYIYSKPCTTQCLNYPSEYQGKLYIYFPDKLFNDISKLTFISTHSSTKCKNLEFDITKEGSIDMQSFIEDNPCTRNIDGIEKVINNIK
ncbi:MAG TPA: hypothetical protein EYG73_00335 [Arcobacter sp.]|nr:hypothetical protein [Arcobacter sp.]